MIEGRKEGGNREKGEGERVEREGGRKEGRKEGREEGRKEGREERSKERMNEWLW